MANRAGRSAAVGTACGKVIVFGEHAVVYGRPAIAVPLSGVRARAEVVAGRRGSGLRIVARDLGRDFLAVEAGLGDPLALIALLTLYRLEVAACDLSVTVSSDLPVARGLGSGAAVSAAIARALAAHVGRTLSPAALAALVFEAEKLYHGTPSGIDNTVIAYEQPIYFVKDQPAEPIAIRGAFTLAIGDSGIASSTREAVESVRQAWAADRLRYEALFDACGRLAAEGRSCMEAGDWPRMGRLMDENHAVLQEIGVSSPELDRLVGAARAGGALGAKLCGAGRGGNMVALIEPGAAPSIHAALRAAGATGVIVTQVAGPAGAEDSA